MVREDFMRIITRREFTGMLGVSALGAAALGGLAGCVPMQEAAKEGGKVQTAYVGDKAIYALDYAGSWRNKTHKVDTKNTLYYPVFFIYADGHVDGGGAQSLADELGLVDFLRENEATAYILGSLGDDYDDDEDGQFFLDALDKVYAKPNNLKVVGFGKGASFVNRVVSQENWCVAGIMSYQGETGELPKYGVPAYVSGSGAMRVAAPYIEADKATDTSTIDGMARYANPQERYEIVVINETEETKAEAFANAWDKVFANNGRVGMIENSYWNHVASKEWPCAYVSYVTPEKYDFTRNVVTEDLAGDGTTCLWYEYLPKGFGEAQPGSVPLVMMLHGNGNDPRSQFVSSGWAEVASNEGIMLLEPEWQGSTIDGVEYAAMTTSDSTGDDNLIPTMIESVLAKYSEIDTSRIYVEGLSRGAANTANIGLTCPELFAGVASHSGATYTRDFDIGVDHVTFNASLADSVERNAETYDLPWYFVVGDSDDTFPLVPMQLRGTQSELLLTLRNYQQLNGMKQTEYANLDGSVNEYFGFEPEGYGQVINSGSMTMYGGTLSNDAGEPRISLNVINSWSHWNYEPTAQLIWDFLKHYRREGTALVYEA